ncbi:MAG TPA: DNA recombination protein RmuC [Candidatus Faecivivens stercoravium]|uniref:DNA recombination protein RmuC n=1 Tax=Candidatus Faecivivens stercoravium TaxID=2840803 RepID=A0A9D1DZ24_9FIRM|nr:DNA recombination protein RmuC [Candidatus Faecivivens stercoravium]
MESLILALVLLSVILSAAGFWAALMALRAARRAGRDTADDLEELLDEALARMEGTLSDASSRQASRAAETFGSLIAQNQHTASAAQQSSLQAMERQLYASQASTADALRAQSEEMRRALRQMQADTRESLEKIRASVDEQLQTTLERRVGESFKAVSGQLEQVYKGLGEMQALAAGVGDLKKILGNVKTRGILGEVQLSALLSEILAPEQYLENAATVPGSSARVEFAVRMPGEEGHPVLMPVDSKFPADAYMALQDAYESADPARVKEAGAQLESRLKSFAKDIRDKYISPPDTTAFGVMFLPFEGLYAEAVNRGMVEALQREYGVSIAGPSTMAALLNALQMGFRSVALSKRSQEVWRLLGAVRTEFDRFAEVLASTQKRLQLAGDDLDKLVGARTRAISRKLREVERLDPDSAREALDSPED